MARLQLTELLWVGENDHGYTFAVARLEGRWVGFAAGCQFTREARAAFEAEGFPYRPEFLFFLPEVGENYLMGVPDRDRAILLTGAVAQDPGNAYGGIARWFVPPELRGDPATFRCPDCDQINCGGQVCENGEDFDQA